MKNLLLQLVLLSLFLCTLPAQAQAGSTQDKNSESELYYDKEQDIYYDDSEVCKFLADYINIEKHILRKEWDDISNGRYMSKKNIYHFETDENGRENSKMLFVMYEYESNGIKVGYSKLEGKLKNIWYIVFSPNRLPAGLKKLSYYQNLFQINNLKNGSDLNLECDGIILEGKFKDKIIKQLTIYISLNSI